MMRKLNNQNARDIAGGEILKVMADAKTQADFRAYMKHRGYLGIDPIEKRKYLEPAYYAIPDNLTRINLSDYKPVYSLEEAEKLSQEKGYGSNVTPTYWYSDWYEDFNYDY